MWLNGALLLFVGLGPLGANCWTEDSWVFWHLQTSAFKLGNMAKEFADGLDVQATLYRAFVGMLGAKISHEIVNSSLANYCSRSRGPNLNSIGSPRHFVRPLAPRGLPSLMER